MLALLLAASLLPFDGTKPAPKKVIDTNFVLVMSVLVFTTVSDVEGSYHCINRGTCYERNYVPSFYMRHGRLATYSIQAALTTGIIIQAVHLKRKGKAWWIVPTLTSTTHGALFGVSLRF